MLYIGRSIALRDRLVARQLTADPDLYSEKIGSILWHMSPDMTRPVTLRRSCKACIKGKRQCDQHWPKCSRCLGRGREFVNVPLTATRVADGRVRGLKYQIFAPLPLEIAKEYDQSAIRFLVDGLREYPSTFVKGYKTDFVHPEIYKFSLPL